MVLDGVVASTASRIRRVGTTLVIYPTEGAVPCQDYDGDAMEISNGLSEYMEQGRIRMSTVNVVGSMPVVFYESAATSTSLPNGTQTLISNATRLWDDRLARGRGCRQTSRSSSWQPMRRWIGPVCSATGLVSK